MTTSLWNYKVIQHSSPTFYDPTLFSHLHLKMMLTNVLTTLTFAASALCQVTYQNSSDTRLRVDNGTYGPEIEEVHYCKLLR